MKEKNNKKSFGGKIWDETKGLFILTGLVSLVVIPGAYISHVAKTGNWNLKQETKTELVDSSNVGSNYSQPRDSIYKELGIDKTKYSQKQLDRLVYEAYRGILW